MNPNQQDLHALQLALADQLGRRIDHIDASLGMACAGEPGSTGLAQVGQLLHSLAGAADAFGMHSLCVLARELESRLQPWLQGESQPDADDWQQARSTVLQMRLLAPGPAHPPCAAPAAAPLAGGHSPLIDVVDDDDDIAESVARIAREAGYRVRCFASVAACLHSRRDVLPEPACAVILDLPAELSADAVTAYLRDLRHEGELPILLLSGRLDLPTRVAALRAGARRILHKPLQSGQVIDALDELVGSTRGGPCRVLLVADEAARLQRRAEQLTGAGVQVVCQLQPQNLLEAIAQHRPELVLLDLQAEQADPLTWLSLLHDCEPARQLPSVVISSDRREQARVEALQRGCHDFLTEPVSTAHLGVLVQARVRRARHETETRQRLQMTAYEREREHLALDRHAIVSMAGPDGLIHYVNDKFCEISGYARQELLGQDHRIVKSGIHGAEFYRDLWRCISRGNVWQGEICNRRKDGGLYWVASTITPFLDAGGVPYQYVSIRTDITHVKAAEQALRHSRARLDYLLATSPAVLYSCRAVEGYPPTFVSPNVQDLFGFSVEQCLNEPQFWMSRIHPDDRERVQAGTADLMSRDRHSHEYRFRMPDGGYRWIHDALRVVRDDNRQPSEIVGYWSDIEDRKRAEQEIQIHRERLRRGQIYANIGTWEWNIQTGSLFWTERIAPLFGYPEGELETSYANFLAAVHPDDRQSVIDAVGACIERDVPYEVEHRVVWPDGSVRWLLERGAVSRDGEGRPLQMLGVVQDIDDRKRTELALIERERQLHEAQALARIGDWTADVHSGQLQWSEQIYRIFGLDPERFQPSIAAFREAVHPDDLDLLIASEREAASSGLLDVVHRILRPDGSVRYVHELARAESDADGALIRLVGTVQDITERVEAEARLHETEARFAFAVEGAGDGVWDWELRNNAMSVSATYASLLGYERWEIPPRFDSWITSIHPDDVESTRELLQRYLDGQVTHFTCEKRLRCRDGSYKWMLCRGTVVERDRDGRPLRMIGIHSDISDRKRGEQALIAAREEAERANQAKSEFLSGMSHELRTPMNAILGFGQLMAYDPGLPTEHRDNVQEILHAGQHLLNLINEVLDLSKVESGRLEISLEALDPSPLLEECLTLLEPLAEENRIDLAPCPPLADILIAADRTRFKQVLLNLLSNAIKYNHRGGSVRIAASACADRVRIEVIDTGPGIPEQRLPELFLPFSRLGAEASPIEGTGIGLALTRRLVEMMGGSVGVRSQLGHGSTFWIELPRALDAAAPMPRRAAGDSAAQPEPTGAGSNQRCVLYIEDNPSNLRLVTQILARRPQITLLTAPQAELGIQLARTRLPQLILLDINMPVMDGYQVLQALRDDPLTAAITTVAVTANAMARDIERGLAAGFDAYLTKPLDVGQLLALVDQALLPPGETTP